MAYLALVPSKDEADLQKPAPAPPAATEDEDDDLIIIDPPTSTSNAISSSPVIVPSPLSPSASADGLKSPTVLGKRRNDQIDPSLQPAETELDLNSMVIDSQPPSTETSPAEDIMVDDSAAPLSPASNSSCRLSTVGGEDGDRTVKRGRSLEAHVPSAIGGGDLVPTEMADGVVELRSADEVQLPQGPSKDDKPAPPPLPPRPSTSKEAKLEEQVSSYMAFGELSLALLRDTANLRFAT